MFRWKVRDGFLEEVSLQRATDRGGKRRQNVAGRGNSMYA